ncbi:MAG: gspC [Rhizobacter sp.]|nr:gspC [Rhizobacter sp.]
MTSCSQEFRGQFRALGEMAVNHNRRMLARITAFGTWTLVATGLVFWALRLFVMAPAVMPGAVAFNDAGGSRGELARLLGGEPSAQVAAAPVVASRFKLVGVVAPRQGQTQTSSQAQQDTHASVALIAIDDKPPRPYRIGARIDGETVLQAVGHRSASLGASSGAGQPLVLEIAPLPAPATGALTALPFENGGFAPAQPQPRSQIQPPMQPPMMNGQSRPSMPLYGSSPSSPMPPTGLPPPQYGRDPATN